MKTIKCLVTLLAIAASTAVWGQQNNDHKKAFDGYFECHAIAEKHVEELSPFGQIESFDAVCYYLGVNYGVMIVANNFYDDFSQINLDRFLMGINDAMQNGEPSNPYGYDSEWAKQFEISPYDMNATLNRHLETRNTGNEVLTALSDSTCYLLGVNYGLMFKGNDFFDDISQIRMNEFLSGLKNAISIKGPEITDSIDTLWASKFKHDPYELNDVINKYVSDRKEYKKALNKTIEDYFLIVNAKRNGVVKTNSGLQYILHSEGEVTPSDTTIIRVGEGGRVAPTDTVVVNYRGYLLDGTEFDSGEEISFQANKVIEGWTEGLGLIGKGGKITLFIPSHLAYGERGVRNVIEPNMLLVFDVEVLDIKHEATGNDEQLQ